MEPRGSLPHSQLPATYTNPEPPRSSPNSTSHFLKIHLNIILPSMHGSPKWSLALRIPHQTLYEPILSPIRATCSAHLILLQLISRKISDKQYRSLSSSLYSFLHSPLTSSPLDPNILNTRFSNTLSLRSSLNVSDQVSHPNKTTGFFKLPT